MYDPSDDFIRFEEWSEKMDKKDEQDDMLACQMVDEIQQGDYE